MQFVSAISSDLRLYAVSSSSRGITPRESEMAARDGGLMPFPLLFWSWITMLLICTDSLYFFFSHSKKPGSFDKHDFELLAPVLDGFSLMTYDYSNHGRYK